MYNKIGVSVHGLQLKPLTSSTQISPRSLSLSLFALSADDLQINHPHIIIDPDVELVVDVPFMVPSHLTAGVRVSFPWCCSSVAHCILICRSFLSIQSTSTTHTHMHLYLLHQSVVQVVGRLPEVAIHLSLAQLHLITGIVSGNLCEPTLFSSSHEISSSEVLAASRSAVCNLFFRYNQHWEGRLHIEMYSHIRCESTYLPTDSCGRTRERG